MQDIDIHKIASDYHKSNFYRAKVLNVDRADAYNIIQIMIFGLTDDMDSSCQPWAEMQFPVRLIAYPNPGDHIWIFLENDDIFRPVYLGTTYAPWSKVMESQNIQARVPDDDFEGELTTAPHKKVMVGGKWWKETTLKGFMPTDDPAVPGTILDRWTTVELDDNQDHERLQLLFMKSEGYITFSKKGHDGLEIYTNGTYNIESRNKYNKEFNSILHRDAGWRVITDGDNWITSLGDTHIQAGVGVDSTGGLEYSTLPKQLHLEATGNINLQSLNGSSTMIRASGTGGKVQISGNDGIIIGPDTGDGDIMDHSKDSYNNGLHGLPILLGDGEKGRYFLYIDADNIEDAGKKLGSIKQFLTMCKMIIDMSDLDSIAKNFAGQVAGGLGIPFAGSLLTNWEDGYTNFMDLGNQHLLEAWDKIRMKAIRD